MYPSPSGLTTFPRNTWQGPALTVGVTLLGGLLALFVGGTVALLGGVFPAIVFTVMGFGLLVLFNYRLGVWLLVLLIPFAATQLIPRQMLGVTGLNPVNALLVATVVGLAVAFAFQRGRVNLVPLPAVLLLYLAMIGLAALHGVFRVAEAPPMLNPDGQIEKLSQTTYVLDVLVKPAILLAVAWLAAVQVRNAGGARALVWAMALTVTILFTVVMIFLATSGLNLQVLASTRARGFLSWIGMHANELGLMANMMFAVLLFTALGAQTRGARLLLLAAAGMALLLAALTFSRGAFLGILVVAAYFLLTRRRFWQLFAGLLAVGLAALFLPDAFIERATTGLHQRDVTAITAGRFDDIWLHLWPWVWDSPVIGHGLSSTLWAPANISGAMLPVGHPHNAYLGVLMDVGLLGALIVIAFFWSMWRLFRRLKASHPDAFWRGLFEGGSVCILLLLVQGITDDRFVPTYPQYMMWLAYGLALGHAANLRQAKPT